MLRDFLTRTWQRLASRSSDSSVERSEGLAEGTTRVVLHRDDYLQGKSEKNWARVPYEKRTLCVQYLRSQIPQQAQQEIAEAFEQGFPPFFHFDGGMAVRNTLRDVMSDDELPPVKYDHAEGEFCNWDDFYMAALRQAVAPKPGEA